MIAKAFCPGHITGFFVPYKDHDEMIRRGSRGAGFSVSLGATATVKVHDERRVTVNGKKTIFPVIERVLNNFTKDLAVDIETKLPFSQGFGMSGACALSTAMAACSVTEIDLKRAVEYAHTAEVECKTGLGDVVAQSEGGFEMRIKEGIPPYGAIKKMEIKKEVVLAVLDIYIDTSTVLSDKERSISISAAGNRCINNFSELSLDRFIELSNGFAHETGFLSKKIESILSDLSIYGKGSMCMIGNSVFLVGDTGNIIRKLKDHIDDENVYLTDIDNQGARLI